MKNSFELPIKIVGGFLFFLAWVITDHYAPWNTFHQEFLALAGMFLLFPWKNNLQISLLFKVFITIWCSIIMLQILTDRIYFGDFIFGMGVIFILSMAYLCGVQRPNQKDVNITTIFYAAILAASLAGTIVGLSQWRGVSAGLLSLPSPSGRVYGNMAQPNQLATLLVLGIISLLYFDITRKVRIYWTLAAALALSFTLAATESRTGALSFSVLMVLVFIFRKRPPVGKTLRWLLPAFAFFWIIYSSWSSLTTGSSRSGVHFNPSGRFELWEQMFVAIKMQPWLGWGWLQLGDAQYSVMKTSSLHANINIDHAHNLLIDFLVWFGVPAGFTLIAILFIWLVKSIQHIIKNPQNSDALMAFFMLTPLGIHSLLEYPFAYIYFLIPIGFFIGAIDRLKIKSSDKSNIESRAILAFSLVTLCFSIAVMINYMRIEKDFFAARSEREFFTKKENLHTYENQLNILTQYQSLINLTKSNHITSINISDAKKTAMRFPWLSNYQQYYVELLRNRTCLEAQEHMGIIEILFGEFGAIKSSEAVIYAGVSNTCEATQD